MKKSILKYFVISASYLFLSPSCLNAHDIEAMTADELIKAFRQLEQEKKQSERMVKDLVVNTLGASKNDWKPVLASSQGNYKNAPSLHILQEIEAGYTRIFNIFTPTFQNQAYVKSLMSCYYMNQINGLFDCFVNNYRSYYFSEPIEQKIICLYVQHAEKSNIVFGVDFAEAFKGMIDNIKQLGGIEPYKKWIESLQIPTPPPPPPPPGFSTSSRKTWGASAQKATHAVKLAPGVGASVFNADVNAQFLQKALERQARLAEQEQNPIEVNCDNKTTKMTEGLNSSSSDEFFAQNPPHHEGRVYDLTLQEDDHDEYDGLGALLNSRLKADVSLQSSRVTESQNPTEGNLFFYIKRMAYEKQTQNIDLGVPTDWSESDDEGKDENIALEFERQGPGTNFYPLHFLFEEPVSPRSLDLSGLLYLEADNTDSETEESDDFESDEERDNADESKGLHRNRPPLQINSTDTSSRRL